MGLMRLIAFELGLVRSPRKVTWESLFLNWFCFHPSQIGSKRYQQEALIKLAFLANAVCEEGKGMAHYTSDAIGFFQGLQEEAYNRALSQYESALACLGHFAPDLVSQIPHWSELSGHLEQWFSGETVPQGGLKTRGSRSHQPARASLPSFKT